MERRAWVKLLSIEEKDDHARGILPSKPPVTGWSEGFLNEISEVAARKNGRFLLDLSSIRFVNRQIFEFLVELIRRAENEGWQLVLAGPNRVVGPHPLMRELSKHCVIARSLEDGEAYLQGIEYTVWTPGEEVYNAPIDWNSLTSMLGCLIVPLGVIGLLLWLWLR